MSKPKIKKVVQGVHMGLGHTGLAELLKKEAKVDVQALEPGELVLCLNTFGDKLKILGQRGLVIGYLKLPGQQRIMMNALQYIPETFGGSGFNYDLACRRALEKRFDSYPQRTKSKVSPLEAARMSA